MKSFLNKAKINKRKYKDDDDGLKIDIKRFLSENLNYCTII